ncbi:MAG: hypothetical protein HRU14_12625, partial [Planctomycetes bacterium]|nr:hypothetical protein [Planctomycetota bacterium]
TMMGSEIKNSLGWSSFDTSSSGVVHAALTNVTFSNNHFHHNNGSISVRGMPGSPTTSVTITGNTWNNIGQNGTGTSNNWACIEVNTAVSVVATGNSCSDVLPGSWGEGQAFQLWHIDHVDVSGNTILDCHQGIWFANVGNSHAAPTGSISNNIINGCADASAGGFALQGSTFNPASGVLNAENNYWGDGAGPSGNGPGNGGAVTGSTDFTPWVTEISVPSMFATLTEAVDAAVDNETILVDAAAYNASNPNETLGFGTDVSAAGLTIMSSSSTRVQVTGGVYFENAGTIDGLTLQDLYISGEATSGTTINMANNGEVSNLTMSNCVIDGENAAGRNAWRGKNLSQTMTMTGCEIKDSLGWSVFDMGANGLPTATSPPLTHVTFSNNHFHHLNGSIAVRGHATPTALVTITGNTWDHIGDGSSVAQNWACIEVNKAASVVITSNSCSDVLPGNWGEGQAFQLWHIDDVNVSNNTILNCWQGIWFANPAGSHAAPTGSISNNTFDGITDKAFFTQNPFVGGGLVNAENNWWGHCNGPSGDGPGVGAVVTGDVDFTPWLAGPAKLVPSNYASISEAVVASCAGDTIVVDAAAYNAANPGETLMFGASMAVPDLTIRSSDPNTKVQVTGGVQFANAGTIDNLLLQDLYVTGEASGSSIYMGNAGELSNLTLRDCVIDGEDAAGRHAIRGGNLSQTLTMTGCEIKNSLGWSSFDTSASGVVNHALTSVTFTQNYFHHNNGSISVRGLASSPTSLVTITGNTWNHIGQNGTGTSNNWACIEVNTAVSVRISGNSASNTLPGSWGEGQAFQLWHISDIDVHSNTLTNNHQGIWFANPGNSAAAPVGAIHHNTISGTADFALQAESAFNGGGTVNAEYNWWGHPSGPTAVNAPGIGGTVIGYVDYTPWLSSAPFTLSIAQDPSSSDVNVTLNGGSSGDAYFVFHSLDPQNGVLPGGGWLGGLYIGFGDFYAQYLAGVAGNPLFGGTLDAAGQSDVGITGGGPALLSGLQVWGVAVTLNPSGVAVFSQILEHTFL